MALNCPLIHNGTVLYSISLHRGSLEHAIYYCTPSCLPGTRYTFTTVEYFVTQLFEPTGTTPCWLSCTAVVYLQCRSSCI